MAQLNRTVEVKELVHHFYFNAQDINISSEKALIDKLKAEDFLPNEVVTSENVMKALFEVTSIFAAERKANKPKAVNYGF